MQHVDASGLNDLDGVFAKVLEEIPRMRRDFVDRLGTLAKNQLDSAIDQSGLNDSHGNVKRWQVKRMGSRGGYTVVRAAGKGDGADTGPNGPGAVTNALNQGHIIRNPSGHDPNYRPRIKKVRVPGFGVYQSTRSSIEAAAIREADTFAEQIAGLIGG